MEFQLDHQHAEQVVAQLGSPLANSAGSFQVSGSIGAEADVVGIGLQSGSELGLNYETRAE